jgi:hypothetical protein
MPPRTALLHRWWTFWFKKTAPAVGSAPRSLAACRPGESGAELRHAARAPTLEQQRRVPELMRNVHPAYRLEGETSLFAYVTFLHAAMLTLMLRSVGMRGCRSARSARLTHEAERNTRSPWPD